jgi:hypothetical protein
VEGAVSYIFRAVVLSVLAGGVVLGGAIDARAGLIDYIWDTSGPQFIGKVFRCRGALRGGGSQCDPLFGRPASAPEAPVWLSVESGVYVSLWKNSRTEDGTEIDFRIGRTLLLAFEPIVEFRSVSGDGWSLHHGIGATGLVMASKDFPRTGNLGYKVRLAAVEWTNGASVAFNVRLLPDGFGGDEFGVGPRPPGDRPFETSVGVMVALPYSF